MVAQIRPARFALRALVAVVSIAFASSCDKVPLLAPSGTVITLFPTTNTVPLNGEVEIVAMVIEQGTTAPTPTTPTPPTTPTTPTTPGTPTPPPTPTPPTTSTPTTGAGTPVQNGTVVSFTTTIGRIEPAEARTSNGQVRVRFIAGGQSGNATITAFSGGASGRLENLRVGSAAVERVIVSANPQQLPPSGGTSQLQARVEDSFGLAVPGVDVTFTATTGTVSPNPAVSDSTGIARATLTTTRESTVTATVAGKTSTNLVIALNPRTGVTISGPTTPVSAGQPVAFTVGVGSGTNAPNIVDVLVNFGDGTSRNLGALSAATTTVSHVYTESGTYTATATARDASGFVETVGTEVFILPQQPPSVVVNASNTSPVVGEVVILTATVSGNTSTIVAYEWNFGSGAGQPPITTTSNRATASWNTTGSKVITVRAVQAQGPAGEGFGTVVVRSGAN